MTNYGDVHFVCFYGAPRWLPVSWGYQIWFWSPGTSSQSQTESERQWLTQKPKGLFGRVCDERWRSKQHQPLSFSPLWPIGRSLVLYEIEERDDLVERIAIELSKRQIEARIFAIRSWLSGCPVQFDFVGQLRLSGFRRRGSVFVSPTQNTPESLRQPIGYIGQDGFVKILSGQSFFFNIPNVRAHLRGA